MGVDIPALVQAFNLERKSIAVNSTEAVVFREVLGLGVAIMIGASHADDDIFKASKRHVVTGGFDYRNMKMRGLSLIELEIATLKILTHLISQITWTMAQAFTHGHQWLHAKRRAAFCRAL